MENIVLATFPEESLAYQAYSEIKNAPPTDDLAISQLVLLNKQWGKITVKERYDSGVETADDTLAGGLIGTLAGVLAGPVGMLLGASVGMLVGSIVDSGDAKKKASYIEQAEGKIAEGSTALVALAMELDTETLDERLKPFDATVSRFEAEVMQAEVEEAINMQDQLAMQVRDGLVSDKVEKRIAKCSADIKKLFER